MQAAAEHPGWVDAAVVGFALFASAASVFFVAERAGWPVALVLAAVPALALARRRQAPRAVLTVLLGLGLLQWALAVPINGAQTATLIALYTVARYDSRAAARIALGATMVLLAIAPLRQPYVGVITALATVALVVVVHLIGLNVSLRHTYLAALEERARRLERERDGAALVAAGQERTRIARELHDIVAHHVSVMVVQAEGAGWALDDRPEQARAALVTIAGTGRSTLVELRRLLGVLRNGDQDGVRPQPGAADLPGLVDGFRRSGLLVDLTSSSLDSLPEALQLAVFRIVQEGLTNVLKHAGPAARAEVEVRAQRSAGPGAVLVQIRDDGVGERAGSDGAKVGHGLIGIRERAALFDGRVEVGPAPGGGFAVRAELPLPAGVAYRA